MHPALVWDLAVGHSTLVTRRVIANLFYRGLVLRRFPVVGDTLATSTRVVALEQNRVTVRESAEASARDVLDWRFLALLP